jgi:hypothetical protein
MVGANIMAASYAFTHLEHSLVPTKKTLRNAPGSILKGVGVIHDVLLRHDDLVVALDFHVFDVYDFNFLIGHPFKKLFLEAPILGILDVELGRETFSILISQTKNSPIELLPQSEPVEEVMAISCFESSESSLEYDAELFIQEEDDLEETLDLPTHERPTQPPIKLKPLPSNLLYAFLNGDTESPVIISDRLSGKETAKLLAVLEKHKPVFSYSLQDLKGISSTICTHRIPLDPASTPSREPQRRLNNTIREVVKKEVLKLLHAVIIYPVPHSEWVSPVQVVPKKGGMMVVENSKNKLIPQRTVMGWRMCIDYRKLNSATKKDHFLLPFIDKMLEQLAKHYFFYFLDGYSGYHQIPIHPDDQSKTTFTCPYGTYT